MKFQIPEKVNYIIDILRSHGFEAYIVGGCVRDMVLNREPEDWDITTSATPDEVKQIFHRTVDTGIQHGTVTVLVDKDQFEVTTYRLDGKYEDNRHPKDVFFTTNLEEDLRRRDFTINAMAYNEEHGIIDIFGGLEDLKKGYIRCVGSAKERIEEDALRILRAVRFSAQLDFIIEEDTLEAIKQKAKLLSNISAERIRVELTKLLISDHADRIRMLYETGITNIILPEFDNTMITEQNNIHHVYNVGEHIIRTVLAVGGNLEEKRFSIKDRTVLRWTMMLHDIEKPASKTVGKDGQDHFYGHQEKGVVTAKEILRRLKFDNETLNSVLHLIRWHDYRFVLTPYGMRKAASKIGKEYMHLLFEVNRADTMGKNPTMLEDKINELRSAMDIYDQVLVKDECVSLKELKISGKDLIAIGYRPGKEMGLILDHLLVEVIENPDYNDRDKLLALVNELYPKKNLN